MMIPRTPEHGIFLIILVAIVASYKIYRFAQDNFFKGLKK